MPGLLEIDLSKRVLEGFPFSGPKAHVGLDLYQERYQQFYTPRAATNAQDFIAKILSHTDFMCQKLMLENSNYHLTASFVGTAYRHARPLLRLCM